MSTIGIVVTITAITANAFSGVCAMLRLKLIRERIARVGVPESWLVFPIGTAKVAGAIGLLLGMLGVPMISEQYTDFLPKNPSFRTEGVFSSVNQGRPIQPRLRGSPRMIDRLHRAIADQGHSGREAPR